MSNTNLSKGKVAQGYLATTMKGRFSALEMKIFTMIVRECQIVFNPDEKLAQKVGSIICADGVHVQMTLRVSEVLGGSSHNYKAVKQALSRLMEKQVEHYDYDKKQILFTPLIYNGVLELGTGLVRFECSKWVIQIILDFSKGFSLYYFKSAMSLRRPAAMRLYMLLCNQYNAITFPLKYLKEMFGDADAYKQNTDFIRRVIVPAQKELEDRKLNGFDFECGKSGRLITSITFRPIKREEPSQSSELSKYPLFMAVPKALQSYLQTQCQFTTKEIAANKDTIYNFTRVKGWEDKLMKIIENQRRKRANHGYIINAMKQAYNER